MLPPQCLIGWPFQHSHVSEATTRESTVQSPLEHNGTYWLPRERGLCLVLVPRSATGAWPKYAPRWRLMVLSRSKPDLMCPKA